jgi:hypothetical protein
MGECSSTLDLRQSRSGSVSCRERSEEKIYRGPASNVGPLSFAPPPYLFVRLPDFVVVQAFIAPIVPKVQKSIRFPNCHPFNPGI